MSPRAFDKIHLDYSMGCAGEPAALATTSSPPSALRASLRWRKRLPGPARLSPVYIIGTEVPPPGGATHAIADLEVTTHRAGCARRRSTFIAAAFAKAGVEAALDRVIGIVVQPGVEFGNANVVLYQTRQARGRSALR